MAYIGTRIDHKLHQANEFIEKGRKMEAREVLKEVLSEDRNNLIAWELLWHAVYTVQEELTCLNHILALDPEHPFARERLTFIIQSPATSVPRETSQTRTITPLPNNRPASPRTPMQAGRKRRPQSMHWMLLGLSIPFALACTIGFALYRTGYFPHPFSSNLTATAVAQNNIACEAVIEKAMQIADNYCGQVGSSKACYGNSLVQAELAPDTQQKFSERGDIIDVHVLRRLSASPLSLDSNQWGIAIFKLIANLPRSLPGQTVTMVVFGNTQLDNVAGNLESFYFSSEMGRIVCEQAPQDGIMITVPDGEGVQLMVNGTELTLMGSASLRAARFGRMEVSLFSGAGRMASDGQEQYFGAGQQVSVRLGGEDGMLSVSPPSAPQDLSQDDLNTSCTLTGQFCTPEEITPVSGEQARALLGSELGGIPAATPPASDIPADPQTPPGTPVPTDNSSLPSAIAPTPTSPALSNGNNGQSEDKRKDKDKRQDGKDKGKPGGD